MSTYTHGKKHTEVHAYTLTVHTQELKDIGMHTHTQNNTYVHTHIKTY